MKKLTLLTKVMFISTLGLCCLSAPGFAWAWKSAFDSSGIDALKLHKNPYNLIGRKIAIGQVEIGRPGEFGLDKVVSKNFLVSLAGVFLRNGFANSNQEVDSHAYDVAALMVGKDKAFPGIAPGARLYSGAVGSTKTLGQAEECSTTQKVAQQNGGDVRAINFSFGEPLNRDPRVNATLDGNALLTMCIDWSARVQNTLYVIAGNQGRGGISIPTDNYNGINVAFSSTRNGVFNQVDVANLALTNQGIGTRLAGKETDVGMRRSVSLVAPGRNIPVVNQIGKRIQVTGTSFAAPQVTATVALLQEFGDRQLFGKKPHWSLSARRHEVMKAVLLNSADKIKDNGNGLRLGMTRTLIDKQGRDWLASDADKNPKIPLDAQMGAGHLNTFRALEQFSGGQWQPSAPVPVIGWDYNTVSIGRSVDYVLAKPLKQGSFVSITLAWDRLVELNDKNHNGEYDVGEDFRDRGLNNLVVYLMKANGNEQISTVCSSVSQVDSLQHIFCPVPATANYKIRVQFRQQVNQPTQSYALAWWGDGK